jgi:hypothetical protein
VRDRLRCGVNTRLDDQRVERNNQALEKLEAIHRVLVELRDLFDAFAQAFLDARFPYGDGKSDRWGRRRG